MTDVKRPSRDEAEEAIRTLLRWIGEDDQRKGLLRTPTRVLGCYDEWFGGYKLDPREILGTSFPEAEGYNDIVVLKDVDFESHCEHHRAPFIGAHRLSTFRPGGGREQAGESRAGFVKASASAGKTHSANCRLY
jgi:GTP cyclohydrolase I